MKLFGAAGRHTVLVCDRYAAYKKLARIPGGSGHSRIMLGASTPRLYPLRRRRGAADAVV